jgi:hypothetical protein
MSSATAGFQAQVALDQVDVAAKPILKLTARFNDVHSAQR